MMITKPVPGLLVATVHFLRYNSFKCIGGNKHESLNLH